MNVARIIEGLFTAIAIVLVVALLFGQLFGQPILFGFVETGSMEPTMAAGDGFVAIPATITGDPKPGDVVVFEARTLHDGGLTTHRIVGETPDGYVTKGDANPFTDQDGGEPPVPGDRIVAHALQIRGTLVTIPHLGTAITLVRGVVAAPFEALDPERAGTVLVFAGIGLFVLAGVLDASDGRGTVRTRQRRSVVAVWAIVFVATVIVAGAATAAMVLPGGTQEVPLLSTENPTDDPLVLGPGESSTVSYETYNDGIVPTLVLLESTSEGVSVGPDRAILSGGDRTTVTIEVTAPSDHGTYVRTVRESRYLLLLPPWLLVALHRIHPLLALLAVDVVVAAFVVATSIAVFGTGHLRLRGPPEHVPLAVRLRRRLRGLL